MKKLIAALAVVATNVAAGPHTVDGLIGELGMKGLDGTDNTDHVAFWHDQSSDPFLWRNEAKATLAAQVLAERLAVPYGPDAPSHSSGRQFLELTGIYGCDEIDGCTIYTPYKGGGYVGTEWSVVNGDYFMAVTASTFDPVNGPVAHWRRVWVPEPGSLALISLGLIGLWGVRRGNK